MVAVVFFCIFNNEKTVHKLFLLQFPDAGLVLTLKEPLSEKPNSYRTVARLQEQTSKDSSFPVNEKIIVYFKKDSLCAGLGYGTRLFISKTLQPIRNSGNPGSFDYEQFCARQGISYQVFLKSGEFVQLKQKDENFFAEFLINSRKIVIDILRKYIPGEKEAGLAEALLIGYKDDLDKELVAAYSGAGVVHIIAISGLHLGIIYGMLNGLFMLIGKKMRTRWLKPIIIISGLWVFSLLAGASASVLRSALMFTCIVLGESLSRKTSIYNTLAASAFLLLCYDPYWLWDVGFQLSYVAVLSIVVFYKPIYDLLFFKNKIVDAIWKLNAITLAAQLLTLPFTIFYFHQFPNYFLLANFVAVPLSSLILIGEIILCLLSAIPPVAGLLGWLIKQLLTLMNFFIEWIDQLPASTWEGLQIDGLQASCLFVAITGLALGILTKNKNGVIPGLTSLLIFFLLRAASFSTATKQQKMIVYNIPGNHAIDLIQGRNYFFYGDSLLQENRLLRNFHLDPSRTGQRITATKKLESVLINKNIILFGSKKILVISNSERLSPDNEKLTIDMIILCRNPSIKVHQLLKCFNFSKLIVDNSNSWWRMDNWEKECRSAGLEFHRTDRDGAFVLNLQ